MEGIQYGGDISLVRWSMFSTDQYGGCSSSVWWRVCSMDLSHHQYGEDVQYRTTRSAQGQLVVVFIWGK